MSWASGLGPARRDDGFKRAAREVDGGKQGALDL